MSARLLTKLHAMGVISSTASLAKADDVTVAAFCRRRLPVVMVRLRLSETLREALTLIEGGHVRVGPEVVKDGAFLVTRSLEDFVTWVDSSKIKRQVMRYNNKVRRAPAPLPVRRPRPGFMSATHPSPPPPPPPPRAAGRLRSLGGLVELIMNSARHRDRRSEVESSTVYRGAGLGGIQLTIRPGTGADWHDSEGAPAMAPADHDTDFREQKMACSASSRSWFAGIVSSVSLAFAAGGVHLHPCDRPWGSRPFRGRRT